MLMRVFMRKEAGRGGGILRIQRQQHHLVRLPVAHRPRGGSALPVQPLIAVRVVEAPVGVSRPRLWTAAKMRGRVAVTPASTNNLPSTRENSDVAT